jgi:hypothetical protein
MHDFFISVQVRSPVAGFNGKHTLRVFESRVLIGVLETAGGKMNSLIKKFTFLYLIYIVL